MYQKCWSIPCDPWDCRCAKLDGLVSMQLSASCQDLLRRMLTPQPEDRITLQQVGVGQCRLNTLHCTFATLVMFPDVGWS